MMLRAFTRFQCHKRMVEWGTYEILNTIRSITVWDDTIGLL